jgi:small conductance mechanosensitive channel
MIPPGALRDVPSATLDRSGAAGRPSVPMEHLFGNAEAWSARAMTLLEHALAAAVILFVGRLAAQIAASMLRRVLHRSRTEPTLVKFLANLVYALILAFVVVAALERLGINTTTFAAVVAAAGLAIGFALQGSLSNFAAGVLIILHHQFHAGDLIEAAGQKGRVIDVQIFSTVLVGEDGVTIIVPNSAITSGIVRVHHAAPAAEQAPTKEAKAS